MKRIMEWLLRHRKIVTSTIILLACAFTIVISLVFYYGRKTEFTFIELLYFVSQVISAIFVISGVVIAVWQYYLSCVDSRRNMDIICVQKAVDLSEYYKDNILRYIAPINYIITNSGIDKILNKIDKTRIKHFDKRELEDFLSSEDIDKLKSIQHEEIFFNVVIKANSIYNLGLSERVIESYEQRSKENESNDESSEIYSEILSRFLGRLITRTLNNMEYFSLHFTHNVADETVVYKSLHQTYIEAIQLLYYNIAVLNPLSPSKYYTNTIELYNSWNDRSLKDEEMYTNGIRNLENKGTVVDNKN